MSRSEAPSGKLPSYVGISCVISGYGPVVERAPARVRTSPAASPVAFDCPPLPTVRDKYPHLFSPEDEEDRRKSLVQKKIESLYGRQVGEEWSKCKHSKRCCQSAPVPSRNDQTVKQPCPSGDTNGANVTPKKGKSHQLVTLFRTVLCLR